MEMFPPVWGFPKMGVPPKWMVYSGKILLKWMIWRYPHDLGNPQLYLVTLQLLNGGTSILGIRQVLTRTYK